MSKIKEAISKALGLFAEDETEDKKEPKRESLRDRLSREKEEDKKDTEEKTTLDADKGRRVSESFTKKRFKLFDKED